MTTGDSAARTPTHRVSLGSWPTPLESAPRLAEAIGLSPESLWLKRDDLTGLGAGGNKIRKLEWTVAAAMADGADTLITTGAPQSNHARLTAAAAARCGLDAILIFPGEEESIATGNLVLDHILGAQIEWTGTIAGDADEQQVLNAAAAAAADRVRAQGRTPAVIPFGGSNATGAHGYTLAAEEITTQIAGVDHVVAAAGSGGMMAGLIAGLGPERVLGIHAGAVGDPHHRVVTLLRDMGITLDPTSLRLRTDQVGEAYSTLSPAVAQAMTMAARTHGLILDPIYSGRALAGLRAEIADGLIAPHGTVVFLASGGLPGLFGNTAATELGAQI